MAIFLSSSDSQSLVVEDEILETTTALVVTPNPVDMGADVTFQATVTAFETPIGSVQFYVDDVPNGPPLVLNGLGVVEQTIAADLPPGNHTIRAEFLP